MEYRELIQNFTEYFFLSDVFDKKKLIRKKILKQQKNKSTEVLNVLLEYKNRIFCICLGFIRNPYDAEDLTQDVYMKALKKLDDLKEPGSAKEWLLRIRETPVWIMSGKSVNGVYSGKKQI